jgi:hypothetical protein
MLVAVVMLGVVGAMAALSIDVVTIYTARSEAQLAADGAALAGARVLANSGMTSKPGDAVLAGNAEALALSIATQMAQNNEVGGRNLVASNGEVAVTFPSAGSVGFGTNPRVTVKVQRTDLPTFFARIWGTTRLTVVATATAEAYNPSGAGAAGLTPVSPVALTCVKPWLLPNIDPSSDPAAPTEIFDPDSGAINTWAAANLLGWTYTSTYGKPMSLACDPPARTIGDCSISPGNPLPTPSAWQYFPGDDATTFPHPTQALPTCTLPLNNYQKSIVGCIQTPISCNSLANIDTTSPATRDAETTAAVSCLTHATNTVGDADRVDLTAAAAPIPPFQFLAGAENPVSIADPALAGKDVLVSSSLVTVPVFDSSLPNWPNTGNVHIIGFVQLFLYPDGQVTAPIGSVNATVINMVGCGTDATGTKILGNGASPVAVRLISAQ